jgi:hypothetical protein
MATFQVVDDFANFLGQKLIDMDTDTWKGVLTNVAPTKAGTSVIGDITQISGAGGYAPVTLTGVTFTETGAGTGIWEFDSDAFDWTASGAPFSAARYLAIYDDTSTNDAVLGFADIGSFTLADGATLTVTPGANGIVRITVS